MSDVDATNKPGAVQDPQVGRRRILQVCGSAAGGVRAHLADCARLLAADGHDVIEVEEVRDVEVLEPRGLIAMADGDRVAEVPFTAHCAPGVVEVLI